VERGLAARGRREPVFTISCFGQCSRGPNLVVGPRREEQDSILGEAQYFIGEPDEYLYCRMSPAAVEEVIEEHLVHGRPVRRLLAEEGGAGN
jgi:(2Fe-2S) ferredoxin